MFGIESTLLEMNNDPYFLKDEKTRIIIDESTNKRYRIDVTIIPLEIDEKWSNKYPVIKLASLE